MFAGNPFAGDSLPPKYSPKTHVDPHTGKIYKLHESGYFWDEMGETIPDAHKHAPPVGKPPLPAFVAHVKSLNQFEYDTIKMTSAISVQRENENFNAHLWERYVRAKLDWMQGGRRGDEPKSPVGHYRIHDFQTLLDFIMAGVDTTQFNPPEIDYNQ
jgi:hypothetical protein